MAQRYRVRRPSNKPQVNQAPDVLDRGNGTGEPLRDAQAGQPRDHQVQAGEPQAHEGEWHMDRQQADRPDGDKRQPVDLLPIVLSCPCSGSANPARLPCAGKPYHCLVLGARAPGGEFRLRMASWNVICRGKQAAELGKRPLQRAVRVRPCLEPTPRAQTGGADQKNSR